MMIIIQIIKKIVHGFERFHDSKGYNIYPSKYAQDLVGQTKQKRDAQQQALATKGGKPGKGYGDWYGKSGLKGKGDDHKRRR